MLAPGLSLPAIQIYGFDKVIAFLMNNMMHSNIVVIGSSNVDMIAKVKRLPRPGETVGQAVFSQAFGGKGANQAVAANRAGGQVSFVTCLGSDGLGQNMLQALKAEGINTEHIIIDRKNPTGTALILVDEQGENSIAVAPGANNTLTPSLIDEARFVISGADIVLLQMEIPLETVFYTLEFAASLGKKVLLNPAPAYKLDEKLFKYLHILVMNETEAETMTDIKINSKVEAALAADEVLRKGVEIAIITMGEQGAYYATRHEKKWIEAYRVQAVDTTAAGDVFCGTLAAALQKKYRLSEAIKFASAAAAISVTKMGAQPSAPTEQEIKAFLSQHEF